MPCAESSLDGRSMERERTATTLIIRGGKSQSFVNEARFEGEVVRWEGREDRISWR